MSTQAVLAAAQQLVGAFASNYSDAYFAAFSEDASFVFHTSPQLLLSRAAYRELWHSWQQDGFEVLACTSSNSFVSLQGEVAIFIHDVSTRLRIQGEEIQSQERETIVFRQQQECGRWLACHEHLSAMPEHLPLT